MTAGRPSGAGKARCAALVTRRHFLQASAVCAGGMAAFGGCVSAPGGRGGEASPIVHENQRAGTRDWLLTKTGIDPDTKYRCPWIEGYCSHTSVRAGETLAFHVSTNPPSPFTHRHLPARATTAARAAG